jgi:inner membrane protein
MDTLTHALSGALLARALTPSRRPTPLGAATTARWTDSWFGPPIPPLQAVAIGAAAATFPDLDFVLSWVSDLAYLRGHRGITHSLLMWPLWSLLIGALAARLIGHPAAWKRTSWIAAAGLGIHILGDWITQFGTMLLAPLSDARFGLGSTFIIDLVVSGIIIAGLLASALWRSSRIPAVVALLLLPAWVGVSLTGRSEALAFARDYAAREGIAAVYVDAAPRPASPFNWTVVVFDGASYRTAHVNTRRTERLRVTPEDHFIRRFSAPYVPLAQAEWRSYSKYGDHGDAALARSAWDHPEFAFFRWFAQFPVADGVERRGNDECVWFIDLRFATPGRETVPFRYGLCRAAEGSWRAFRSDGALGRIAIH